MKNPLVSVVMTTYNRAKYISDAIKSVLDQTFGDFELVIVDDGSTDDTLRIIKSFNDKRIKYYFQNNAGQNPARNAGIIISNGEYIAMIDSDDMWDRHKLEKQVDILDTHTDIGLVYCGTTFIDENNRTIYKKPIIGYKGNVLDKLLMTNFLYNGSCPLFRKSCIKKTGLFDTAFKRMTDWEFYLRFAIYYKFWGIKEYLLKYRIHNETMSNDFRNYESWGFKILDKIFSYNGFPADYLKYKNRAYAMRFRYMGIRCFEKRFMKEAREYFNNGFNRDIKTLFTSDMPFYYSLSYLPFETVDFFRKIRKITNVIS
jgi:glycosyltransferase involved in cell wall biosynthesis